MESGDNQNQNLLDFSDSGNYLLSSSPTSGPSPVSRPSSEDLVQATSASPQPPPLPSTDSRSILEPQFEADPLGSVPQDKPSSRVSYGDDFDFEPKHNEPEQHFDTGREVIPDDDIFDPLEPVEESFPPEPVRSSLPVAEPIREPTPSPSPPPPVRQEVSPPPLPASPPAVKQEIVKPSSPAPAPPAPAVAPPPPAPVPAPVVAPISVSPPSPPAPAPVQQQQSPPPSKPEPKSSPAPAPAASSSKMSSSRATGSLSSLLGPKFTSTASELVYWRDPRRSGAVFGGGLVVLLSLAYFSVISVVAYLLLLTLTGTFAFRVYKTVLGAVQKTNEPPPFKDLLEQDITPSPEKVHQAVDILLSHFNSAILEMRRVFLIDDIFDSLKYGFIFWVLTYIGSWFNGLTLLILTWLAAFGLPKVYEMHKAQIDAHLNVALGHINQVVTLIRTKVPFLAKKEKDN